jgi:hypothetical protein
MSGSSHARSPIQNAFCDYVRVSGSHTDRKPYNGVTALSLRKLLSLPWPTEHYFLGKAQFDARFARHVSSEPAAQRQ